MNPDRHLIAAIFAFLAFYGLAYLAYCHHDQVFRGIAILGMLVALARAFWVAR